MKKSSVKVAIIVVHAGDGTDIEDVRVISEAQSNAMWKYMDENNTDMWDYLGVVHSRPPGRGFSSLVKAFRFINKHGLRVIHESGCGSY